MKRNVLVGSFLIILLGLVTLPFAGSAAEHKQTEYIVLASGEQVAGDYVRGGEAVDLSGTVTGDAMLLGGQIDVLGEVKGDLLGIGGNIEVSGSVGQNVRMVGGNVRVNGEIGRNVSIAGGNLQFNENAVITGNTYAAGGNITTRAKHQGNVSIAAASVIINGVVEGNVEIYAENVVVREQARITGSLTYYSSNDAQISESAIVTGGITKSSPKMARDFSFRFDTKSRLLFLLWKLAAALLIMLVLWKLFRNTIGGILDSSGREFWKKLGWGFVTLIAVPIAAVIALITIVGIPLGLISLAMYVILLYIAGILGAVLFGHFLLNVARAGQDVNKFPWLAVFVGIVVVFVISTLPVVGFILSFALLLWGLGSIVLVLKK